MVTVEVGPQKVSFGFHKGLICSRSPFFEAAFNGSFQETATQSIHLKDDNPHHFDIVHKWFYTDLVTVAFDGKDRMPSGYECLHVYVLADKLDIPRLCDAAIKHISDSFVYHKTVPIQWVLSIYERTGPNHRLRKWLIAVILQNYQNNIDEVTVRNPEALSNCPELLVDLLSAMKAKCVSSPYKTQPFSLCTFHRHKSNEPCPQSGKTHSYTMVKLIASSDT